MICAGCGKEMLEGYIPAATVHWVPRYDTPRLRYDKSEPELGMRIGKLRLIKWANPIAYFCKECKVIVIPTEGNPAFRLLED